MRAVGRNKKILGWKFVCYRMNRRLFGRIFLRYTLLKSGMKSNSARLSHGNTTRRCTRLPQSHILKITVDWCHWSEKKRCMSGDLSSFAYFFPTASPLDGFSTFRRRMQCSYRISWNTRNDKSFKLTRDCVIDLSIIVTANMCSSIVIVLSDCELISQSWYFVKYIQYLEKIIFRK